MSLHVVTGAANAGKTGVVHGVVRETIRHRGSAVLLLPSAPEVARARNELVKDCAIGLSITSFESFLESLWLQLNDGRKTVSRTQRLLLIERAIASAGLEELAESAQRPGFTRLLETLILRAAEGTVFRSTPDNVPGATGELLRILKTYTVALSEENLIEQVESHALVSARLGEVELPDLIAVNRFGSFTPSQEDLLCAASTRCEVWIALTWSKGSPTTASTNALVSRLAPIGTFSEAPAGAPASDAPVELIALERGLLALKQGPDAGVRPSGSLVLSEAWGSQAEASRVAREVQDAISAGVAPGEIAVVFRDPSRHKDEIKAAFKEADIAAQYDLYVPVTSTALGRALGHLLSFFCADGGHRALMGFLRTPYVPVSHECLDEVDARMRRDRVSSTDRLTAMAGTAGTSVKEALTRARRLCSGPIDEKALPEWHAFLLGMMTAAYGHTFSLGNDGRLDAAAARLVFRAVTEMTMIQSERFSGRHLLSLIGDARVATASEERAGHVQVLGAERMRGRRFSTVILGGLTADEFPSLPAQDALSSEKVSRELADYGIDVSPRVDLDAERLLFYQVVTRARHRLILSRRVTDDDGRPVRPSPLLEELLDLYRDPTRGEDGWYHGEPPRRVVTFSDMAEGPEVPVSIRRTLRQDVLDGSLSATSGPRIAHALWRTRPRDVCLSERISEGLATREVYSVSDIELYLSCPYRWYVARVLRPRSLDVELDSSSSGQAAHEVMSRFYHAYEQQTGLKRVTPEMLEQARVIHESVCAGVLESVHVVGLSEETAIRRITRSTWRIIAQDADSSLEVDPFLHEWEFGLGDDEPEAFGSFALAGRIDRIDAGPQGFMITDYKTGAVSGKQKDRFVEEGLVQLPLYAEVVRRRLGLGQPVAGVYRSILHPGKPRGFFLDGAIDASWFTRTDKCSASDIAGLVDDAVARASTAVEGMRAGRIEQAPGVRRCPDYCPARAYCEGRR